MAPLLQGDKLPEPDALPSPGAVVPLSKQLGIISLVEDSVRILGARLVDEIELITRVVLSTIRYVSFGW